jgi:hypothetical protein
MPGAFEPQPSREWKGIADDLREVLTTEEFASARASTPNAHYTSPEVIQTIWQAMQRFGFQAGGHILEPSMGIGHFFGLMPEGLYPGTRRTGVELDSITARIAAKLGPGLTRIWIRRKPRPTRWPPAPATWRRWPRLICERPGPPSEKYLSFNAPRHTLVR